MKSQSEIHNEAVRLFMPAICAAPYQREDATFGAVLTILESVAAGVIYAQAKLEEWDEPTANLMLNTLFSAIRKRVNSLHRVGPDPELDAKVKALIEERARHRASIKSKADRK